MHSNRSHFTTTKYYRESKALLLIATPLLATNLADTIMRLTDAVIVGQLGVAELAAVGVSSALLFNLAEVGGGLLALVGVFVAEAHAAERPDAIRRALMNGLWASLVISILIMQFGWSVGAMLRAIGFDERTAALAGDYGAAAAWAVPPLMAFGVLRAFLSAMSITGGISITIGTAVVLNGVLSYVLCFGEFGFPAMGITGAGYATSVSCWWMFIATVAAMQADPSSRQYMRLCPPDWKAQKKILAIGLPAAGSVFLELGLYNAIAVICGLLGAIPLAANQIAFSYLNVGAIGSYAIGQAAAYRVSFQMAKGDYHGVRFSALIAILLGLALMAILSAAIWAAPYYVASWFLEEGQDDVAAVIRMAGMLLLVASLIQFIDALHLTLSGALMGIQDTRVPFVIGIACLWIVALGLGSLLAFVGGFGVYGLWTGLAIGLTAACVWLGLRFARATSPRPAIA